MTTSAAPNPLDRAARRRRIAIWVTLLAIVVAIVAFFVFAKLYTDILWFQQLGYVGVLTRQWYWGGGMFAAGFLGMAVPVRLCIELSYRLRPMYAKLGAQLDRYQQVVEPLRRLALWGVPAVFGIFAGVAASSRWQMAAQWFNATPSGTKDPQFHLDVSFYLFDLPFYRSLTAFASAVLIVGFLATVATAYVYGSIRAAGRELRIARAARVQIAVLGAVYLAVQAISIWLDRYVTLTDTNVSGMINGAAYTDVNAIIPARAILSGIAFIVAALFVVTAFIGRWRYPLVGLGLLIVSALAIGTIYPWGMQKFYVDPNQKVLESTYIQRAIDGTREAYGLTDVTEQSYNATTTAQQGALRQDATTAASIRIMDPSVISPAYSQLQQFKQFYSFPTDLTVDRYEIDGAQQDTVVGVRELNQSGLDTGAQTWYNDTFVYTHGYGVVAAAGNTRTADGQPQFIESGIPTAGELGSYQPDIYFGLQSPNYSIVGAPSSAKPVEFDYPGGADNATATYNTYQGDGGPKLNSFINRLAYSVKFQNEQILISGAINSDSQILYNRNPLQRVQAAAPYLTLDSTPYASVVNGQVVWIIDGYTTSDYYPYSAQQSYSQAISGSQTPSDYTNDDVNYIRDSVKATVNAYTGQVTLYTWDASDPILQTWQKIFPNTLKPMSDMSGALMSHVRYPQDLFKVQRTTLATYHVTDPGAFYSTEDAWKVPDDPSTTNNQSIQPPYYLTMKVPGTAASAFTLYSTFIPQSTSTDNRSVLKGYLAVDSDAGSTAGHPSADYGKLTLLTIPPDDSVPGPGSVQANVESDPSISAQLNVLRVGGATKVTYGNLLTIPVGGGLLYVEPVYVQSQGSTSYPLLQEVIVSFGQTNKMAPTLDEALDELFGGDSGAKAGDNTVTPTTNPSSPPGKSGTTPAKPSTPATPSKNPALEKALQQAQSAMSAAESALKTGDFAAYGTAQKQLQAAIDAALAAEKAASTPATK